MYKVGALVFITADVTARIEKVCGENEEATYLVGGQWYSSSQLESNAPAVRSRMARLPEGECPSVNPGEDVAQEFYRQHNIIPRRGRIVTAHRLGRPEWR
ncbi:MAG: hypothetical protein KA314_04630 [Chloroflexi bacterium]|nr:hypothetical protein [Chloroflexota bacterium]